MVLHASSTKSIGFSGLIPHQVKRLRIVLSIDDVQMEWKSFAQALSSPKSRLQRRYTLYNIVLDNHGVGASRRTFPSRTPC